MDGLPSTNKFNTRIECFIFTLLVLFAKAELSLEVFHLETASSKEEYVALRRS